MQKRQDSKRVTATARNKKVRLGGSSRPAREAKECFVPQTQLGRRLWAIRRKILTGGQPLLEWEQIEQDLLQRRGERGGEA
jgi:hypothetical protein